MPRLISRPRKKLIASILANNKNADVLTDAEIHAWIDAGELVTA